MRMTTFLLTTLATGLISACDDHLDFLGPDGSEESSRDGIHGSGNIVDRVAFHRCLPLRMPPDAYCHLVSRS
jgi:hypothetical protein